MEFIKIDINNLHLVKKFFSTNTSKYFIYYTNRIYENVIKNHVYTVITKINNNIIGYGHIDFEEKYWIGLYIDNNYGNKGYGKILLNHLIKIAKELNINKLHLSVDKENIIAIYMYNNIGFKTIDENDKSLIMCLTFNANLLVNKCLSVDNTIYLPVSYGEAFDKMSILDIKLNKIKDNRVIDVKKEYDMIKDYLNNIITNNINFYYNILKEINQNIWEKQDIFRYNNDINFKNNLCIDIISENDRRFRVKNKINNLLNSELKEQKGYNKKNAFILTHLGLGDNITSMGIVRYYSTIYDEIYVVCKNKYESNVRLLYQDDKTIHIYPIDSLNMSNDDICTYFGISNKPNAKYIYNNEEYDLITTGMYSAINTNYYTIPFCFYKDVNLDYSIFWEYSYIIDTDESKKLYNELVKRNIKNYIICHTSSSDIEYVFTIKDIKNTQEIDINNTLIIDIGKNIYSLDDPFYDIANIFVMKPIIYYKDTIINASQIYTTDSCLFTMSLLLDIKTDKCYVIPRNKIQDLYNYIFTDEFKFNNNKNRKFKYPF